MGTTTAVGAVRVRPVRRVIRTAAVALAGVAAMGLTAACEPADCTTTFVTASTFGAWNDPSVWNTGVVPTESDIACIGAGWNVELPAGGAVTVKGLKTASSLILNQTAHHPQQPDPGSGDGPLLPGRGSSISIGGGTGNLTLDGGALEGSGDVHGSVSGASRVSPGDPTGTGVGVLTIHGDLVLDATAVPIDLSGNGIVAGIGHDRIASPARSPRRPPPPSTCASDRPSPRRRAPRSRPSPRRREPGSPRSVPPTSAARARDRGQRRRRGARPVRDRL